MTCFVIKNSVEVGDVLTLEVRKGNDHICDYSTTIVTKVQSARFNPEGIDEIEFGDEDAEVKI